MSDNDAPHVNDDTVDEHNMTHLLTERDSYLPEKNRLEKKLEKINDQIEAALRAGGCKRHQMMTGPFQGTMVYIVEPKPSKTIVAEKLLALGVSPDVIKAATTEKEKSPYSRVDAPGATDEQRAARTLRPFDNTGAIGPEPGAADDGDRVQ
jgi:hypothetical protein